MQQGRLKKEKSKGWKLLRDFCKPQRMNQTVPRCYAARVSHLHCDPGLYTVTAEALDHNPKSCLHFWGLSAVCHWAQELVPR